MKTSLSTIAISELSKSIDARLAAQLLEQAKEIEEAFSLKKWKYSQLDGGRFCEVASRIIYAADSANTNLTKTVDDCIRYVENDQAQHHHNDRQALIHISKIIKAAYKLRSQRGAVHVTPKYTADELDARFILECCRWILADILRLFAGTSKNEIVQLIQELAVWPVPLVREYEGKILLQDTTFTTEEEVLAILYYGPGEGLTLPEIIKSTPKDQSGVRRYVRAMLGAKKRNLIAVGDKFRITYLGIQRIEKVVQVKVES